MPLSFLSSELEGCEALSRLQSSAPSSPDLTGMAEWLALSPGGQDSLTHVLVFPIVSMWPCMSHALRNATASSSNENFLILRLTLQEGGLPVLLLPMRLPASCPLNPCWCHWCPAKGSRKYSEVDQRFPKLIPAIDSNTSFFLYWNGKFFTSRSIDILHSVTEVLSHLSDWCLQALFSGGSGQHYRGLRRANLPPSYIQHSRNFLNMPLCWPGNTEADLVW